MSARKDVSALIYFSENTIGYEPILFKSVQTVNQRQWLMILDMIITSLNNSVEGKRIAILGLAFKKNTDDDKDSISLKLIKELENRGAVLKLHDPVAIENTKKILGGSNNITYYKDLLSCITKTECCVIMTEWEEYRNITSKILKKYMEKPNVIDARRILDKYKIDSINFSAVGLGKSYT